MKRVSQILRATNACIDNSKLFDFIHQFAKRCEISISTICINTYICITYKCITYILKVCKVQFPANEDVRGVSWRYCEYDPQLSWNRPRLGSLQIGSAGSLSSCVATIGTICNLRFISSPQISVKDTFLTKDSFQTQFFMWSLFCRLKLNI